MSKQLLWSENDACLAFDEALSDPGLTPTRKQELLRSIIALCVSSPNAFRRLCQYGKQSLLAGNLVRRAREASLAHPKGAAFRDWLDSQPDLQLKMKSSRPVLLTRSQQAAWNALEETAALYFSGQFRHGRIQPRTSRLIAGPSGVGKSHLVRSFAQEKGYGFLLLTYGSWIPSGAKSGEPTAETVMKFVAAHERSMVFIDEIDKFSGLRQEWSVSIQNDLFALLDRTWLQGRSTGVKEEIQRKLRENTWIVAAGTWQELWAVRGGAQAAIGFQQPAATGMSESIHRAKSIPTELLARFHQEILLLEPMTAPDFAEVCRAEGLEEQAHELELTLNYEEAEASGLGMRWVEAFLMKIHLTRARKLNDASTNFPLSP
jgi:hypothetical protein